MARLIVGIAYPQSRLTPKQVKGAPFFYQKVFGEETFVAGGIVQIPIGGSKPAKPAKDNAYVSNCQRVPL